MIICGIDAEKSNNPLFLKKSSNTTIIKPSEIAKFNAINKNHQKL